MKNLHCYFYDQDRDIWYERHVYIDGDMYDDLLNALSKKERIDYWNYFEE